jgi:hypothetical protein
MNKYIQISIGILGSILLITSLIGMNNELKDSDEVDTMLPPCTVDEGMPWPGDEEVTCYWGMSVEILEIPPEAAATDVLVDISWVKDGVWIGIADASQASNCQLKNDYYECQKNGVTLIEGGSTSDGKLQWSPSPGEYRFVAGGDDSETLQQFTVDWEYEASLKSGIAVVMMYLGIGMLAFAIFQRVIF